METVKTRSSDSPSAMNQRPSSIPPTPIGARSAPSAPSVSPLAPPPSAPLSADGSTPSRPPAPPLVLVLDELISSIGGVNGALLASVDGFAIARSATMPNSAAHAAILAAGMGLAHQLAAMGGGSELRQLVIDHDEGLLLLWPIGTGRVLALLTTRRVDQSGLRRFVQSKAHWLSGATT